MTAVRRQAKADAPAEADAVSDVLGTSDSRKRAIALKLTVIARQLGQSFDHLVERDGLSRGKWSIIVAVARTPGVTQRTIAAMLEITEVTAGQLIDRLCADGYLERRAHPKDRRAYCIHLTEAARPFLDRLAEVARIHEEEMFAGLEDAELARLDKCLDVLARNISSTRTREEEEKKQSGVRTRKPSGPAAQYAAQKSSEAAETL